MKLLKVELKKIQETIDFLSKNTWDNISFARGFQLQYGEETITNILLVALQLTLVKDAPKLLNWFIIKQVGKRQEAEIGIDYEFAFHYQSKWFCLPIQAKIMKEDAYPELSHEVENKKTNIKEKQINLFKAYCQKANNSKWGLYAFYNQSDKIKNLHQYWNCKDISTTFQDFLLGLTFVPLDIVYTKYHTGKKPRFTKQFTKLHENGQGFPVRCLFCKLKDILQLKDKYEFKENLELERFLKSPKELIYWTDNLISSVELEGGIITYPKNIIGIDLNFFDEKLWKKSECIFNNNSI